MVLQMFSTVQRSLPFFDVSLALFDGGIKTLKNGQKSS
jgi:hypothetical protein